MRVDCSIANISLFKIDVPLFSESVQFGTKMTKTESDDKIELKEILRLLCLPLGQYFVSQNELLTYLWYLNFRYTFRGLGVIQKFNNDDNDD